MPGVDPDVSRVVLGFVDLRESFESRLEPTRGCLHRKRMEKTGNRFLQRDSAANCFHFGRKDVSRDE